MLRFILQEVGNRSWLLQISLWEVLLEPLGDWKSIKFALASCRFCHSQQLATCYYFWQTFQLWAICHFSRGSAYLHPSSKCIWDLDWTWQLVNICCWFNSDGCGCLDLLQVLQLTSVTRGLLCLPFLPVKLFLTSLNIGLVSNLPNHQYFLHS